MHQALGKSTSYIIPNALKIANQEKEYFQVKDIKIYEHSAHHPHIEDNKLYINDILSFLKSRS